MSHEIPPTDPVRGETGSPESHAVGAATTQGAHPGRAGQGPASSGPSSGHGGQRRAGTEATEHHLRSRSGPRVSTPNDIDALEDHITAAFRQGPTAAWAAVGELLSVTRDVVQEAGRARFLANFGTPVCESCEGLKAGPGVVATCFQRRQCFYANFTADSASSRTQRIIESLTKKV